MSRLWAQPALAVGVGHDWLTINGSVVAGVPCGTFQEMAGKESGAA